VIYSPCKVAAVTAESAFKAIIMDAIVFAVSVSEATRNLPEKGGRR